MIKLIIILTTLIAFLYFANKNILSDTGSNIGEMAFKNFKKK